MSQILKTTRVLRELPGGLTKSDNELWAIASLEKIDEDGDVIRVNGIDLSMHRPPTSFIKILASHLRRLPDGSPPVCGRVEEFNRTSIGGCPALTFRMTWATDGKGNVTELARKYKDLYDGGYLESFSVGASVIESRPLKGGGNDFVKTILREISCVTIPANCDAVVMRHLRDAFGDCLDSDGLPCACSTSKGDEISELRALVLSMQKQIRMVHDDAESAAVVMLAGEAGLYVPRSKRAAMDDDDDGDDESREATAAALRDLSRRMEKLLRR